MTQYLLTKIILAVTEQQKEEHKNGERKNKEVQTELNKLCQMKNYKRNLKKERGYRYVY